MTVLANAVQTRRDLTTVADFEVNEGETIPFVLTYGPRTCRPCGNRPCAGLEANRGFLDRLVQHCTYQASAVIS